MKRNKKWVPNPKILCPGAGGFDSKTLVVDPQTEPGN